MFKLDKPLCPECGEPSIGEVDLIPALANWTTDEEGHPKDWTGETTCWWDGQFAQEVPSGDEEAILVQCGNYHEWETRYEGTEAAGPTERRN